MSDTMDFAIDKTAALQDYYDKAAYAPDGFKFLSPTALDDWCLAVAQWLCEVDRVCEVGPGHGFLAGRVQELSTKSLQYNLIDISQEMLNKALNHVGHNRAGCVSFLAERLDISTETFPCLKSGTVDRVVAINVLQDIVAQTALLNIRKILAPGGMIWVTFIAKEVQEEFWADDEDYDPEAGCWYKSSCYHEAKDAKPMGFRLVRGRTKPYFRVLQCYSRSEILALLKSTGFAVCSLEPIAYPVDFVRKRWKSKYHHMRLEEKQLELLERWQCYPDGWSVKATVL